MTKNEDSKRLQSPLGADARRSEDGLFIDFGRPDASEIERLKTGTGVLARQIEAALDRWRAELGVDADTEVVPVILLYRCDRSDASIAPETDPEIQDPSK